MSLLCFPLNWLALFFHRTCQVPYFLHIGSDTLYAQLSRLKLWKCIHAHTCAPLAHSHGAQSRRGERVLNHTAVTYRGALEIGEETGRMYCKQKDVSVPPCPVLRLLDYVRRLYWTVHIAQAENVRNVRVGCWDEGENAGFLRHAGTAFRVLPRETLSCVPCKSYGGKREVKGQEN